MKFITSLFSDINGSVSSKRLVMFTLLAVFGTCILVNLFTGKNLDPTFKDQLYYAFLWVVTAIFGEQITGLIGQKAKDKE